MERTFHEVNITDLRKYFPVKVGDKLSDDFFISDIRYTKELDQLNYPCRFDGFMAVFCIRGHLTVEINLKSYEVKEGSMVMYVPGNIVRVSKINTDNLENLHFLCIATSRSFLTSARMDLARLFSEGMAALSEPCVHLTEEELTMFGRYLKLVYSLSLIEEEGVKEAIRELLSSAFFYFGNIWRKRIEAAAAGKKSSNTARSRLIFDDFLKLVGEYHSSERGMSFYADKLYLTPKYLSKLVKQVSGQSGPDWIDSYVIIEAKNLLKYSDMPIKEIVYRLNFPNSSVFYKFFKAHTGQTPSEYRR